MKIENQPFFIRFTRRVTEKGFSESQAYGQAISVKNSVQDELDQIGNYTQEELLKKMEQAFDSVN